MNEHKTDISPWTCGKCNGTNMIIVGVDKGIKVFCSNNECLEPFPQLKVTVISITKKQPQGATKVPVENPMKQ